VKGSCNPSGSLSVLVQGTDVISYVPKGNWDSATTGISITNIEGSSITPGVIVTANAVNSCASNPVTGVTVCTANNTDIYIITGSTISSTLTSAGSGTISFTGGSCTNCGVAMDSVHNKAVVALAISADVGGFQFIDLSGTPTLETAFQTMSPTSEISEDVLIDPVRNILLSPNESQNYEIVNIKDTTTPTFFEHDISGLIGGDLDSAAEDCQTGIVMAPSEFTGNVYIANGAHAKFTAGSPGTWTAPENAPSLFSGLSAGASGMAVAQGSHIGIVTGEFGGSAFGAVRLPSSIPAGKPSFADWLQCNVPNDPSTAPWDQGNDPHPVTAYVSPNSNHAIGLVANGAGSPPTFLAAIDLTKLLDKSIVPRTSAHVCDPSVDLVAKGVVTFVAVP
jgi:hypothetical protein